MNRQKSTIEDIEQDFGGQQPENTSNLVSTIHQLRQKNLNEFTVEDMRIAIGQNVGLPILLPIAFDFLGEDICSEGDNHPADLLLSVLNVSHAFWESHIELQKLLKQLCSERLEIITESTEIPTSAKQKIISQCYKLLGDKEV